MSHRLLTWKRTAEYLWCIDLFLLSIFSCVLSVHKKVACVAYVNISDKKGELILCHLFMSVSSYRLHLEPV